MTARAWSRWYESEAETLQLVQALKQASATVQELAAIEMIAQAGHQRFQANQDIKHYGSEKQLGMLKAMGRKRWYDQNKYLHRAFNKLYLMPSMQRITLAKQINEALALLRLYESIQKEWKLPPNVPFMKQLMTQCLEDGPEQALELLREWENSLFYNSHGQIHWQRKAVRIPLAYSALQR